MGEGIAKLELQLVFSEQAKSVLLKRPLPERRRIKRAIEQNAETLLKQYRMARRRIGSDLEGPTYKHWVLVKLKDYATLVNQFGTEVRVHLVYHKDEQEHWQYVRYIFRLLRERGSKRTTRIAELTLKQPNVLTRFRVYFIRGCKVRQWSVSISE